MMFSDPLIPGKLYYLTTHSKYNIRVYQYPHSKNKTRDEDELVNEISVLDSFVYLGKSPEGLELVLLGDGTFGYMDVWCEYHHFKEVVTTEEE